MRRSKGGNSPRGGSKCDGEVVSMERGRGGKRVRTLEKRGERSKKIKKKKTWRGG